MHDLAAGTSRKIPLAAPPGRLMAVGAKHAVMFQQHPQLISLESGEVLHEFAGLATGTQPGAIALPEGVTRPPLALDPRNARFAALAGNTIHVVQFELAALAQP